MFPMNNEQQITKGELFSRFRRMPEMRKFVEENYLDEDLLQAAKRFYGGEEFQAILDYVAHRGIGTRSSVLDLGGGNGVASLAWAWAGHRVILVEPDNSDIVGLGSISPHVRQGEYDIGLCCAVAERLPFLNNTFDVVYARQVLHHVPDLDTVCAEVYRILKPKGLFIATREHVISKPGDLDIFLQKHATHRYTGGENAHLLGEYSGALKRAGFNDIRVVGPLESVINYYPMSQSEFSDLCYNTLGKHLGAKIAHLLATRRFVIKLFGWYGMVRDNRPGRLYSFFARR